jgi:hypothetical protein
MFQRALQTVGLSRTGRSAKQHDRGDNDEDI